MGAIISHINHADTATITNGVGTVARALDGMKTPFLRGLARSAGSGTGPGLNTIIFYVDLGSAKSVSTIGCIGVNADEASGGDAQMLVNASLIAYNGDEILNGAEGNWDTEWGLPWGQACWLHAETPWSIRYLTIRLDISRPAGQFYCDVRRLWIGGGIFLTEGIDTNWSLEVLDASEVTVTQRGGFFANEFERRRRLTGSVMGRDSSEILGTSDAAIGTFHALAAAGRSREVVVTPRSNADTGEKRARHAQTVYGAFSNWSPAIDQAGNIWGIESFAVDEIPSPPLS